MSDLSKQAGILSATEFFRFFIKTIIGIALARLITPSELGSYRQLFLIYSTFSTFLLLGIPQSILYFLPRCKNQQEQNKIISQTINVVSFLALGFAISIYLLRGLIADKFSNPNLDSLLLLYAIYPLFMFITQLYSSIMLGLKAPLRAAKFTVFAIFCDLFLILGVAYWTRNLYYIVWAVVASAFLQWLYARIKLWHYHRSQAPWDFSGFRVQLAYSIPLGLSSIIGMLSVQLDKFMISGFFSPEQFAVFSVGAMELPLIGILSNSVNSILLPHLSSGNPAEMGTLYSGAVRKNALIVFPITALFYLFAEPLMVFLYGAVYADAAIYFKIYLFALPLRIATYGIIFQAFGKTKIIMLNSLFVLIANFALNYLLILKMGMKGAALATVIVTWLSVIVYLVQMKSILKLKLKDYFPLEKIAKTLFVTMISSIIIIPVIRLIHIPLLSMFLGGVIFLMVYLLTGRWFGVILNYDLQTIVSLGKDILRSIDKRK